MKMEKFQEELKKGITLIDFHAPWCAPCRAQEPMIKKIMAAYHTRVSILDINIDENHPLATEYRVQSIPTVILFKSGQEIRRWVGLQTEATITESLDQALSK